LKILVQHTEAFHEEHETRPRIQHANHKRGG
jgi:hypothetical protein